MAGDPFEVVLPAVGEADTRAEDQHLHRAGDQDLASLSEGARSGANVHRQAGDGPALAFDLAGVQAGPDLEPDLLDRVPDRAGAPDRPSGPVENGKKSISGGIHLAAAEPVQQAPDAGVMLLGPVAGADVEHWQRMINVNLLGLLYCTHATLPVMGEGGGGHIVNVASVAGRR